MGRTLRHQFSGETLHTCGTTRRRSNPMLGLDRYAQASAPTGPVKDVANELRVEFTTVHPTGPNQEPSACASRWFCSFSMAFPAVGHIWVLRARRNWQRPRRKETVISIGECAALSTRYVHLRRTHFLLRDSVRAYVVRTQERRRSMNWPQL